jgi:hypothetical protein
VVERKTIATKITAPDIKQLNEAEILDLVMNCDANEGRGLSMLDVYQEQYKDETRIHTQHSYEEACASFHATYPNAHENQANHRGPPVRVCSLFTSIHMLKFLMLYVAFI